MRETSVGLDDRVRREPRHEPSPAPPLSAAANYYLAARSVAAVPFVDAPAGIGRLRDGAVRLLRRAGAESDGADAGRLEAVAARWEATLADDVGLLAAG